MCTNECVLCEYVMRMCMFCLFLCVHACVCVFNRVERVETHVVHSYRHTQTHTHTQSPDSPSSLDACCSPGGGKASMPALVDVRPSSASNDTRCRRYKKGTGTERVQLFIVLVMIRRMQGTDANTHTHTLAHTHNTPAHCHHPPLMHQG